MKTNVDSPDFNPFHEMRSWHPAVRTIAMATAFSLVGSLIVLLIESLAHQMATDRVENLVRMSIIAFAGLLLSFMIARRNSLWILVPSVLAFGTYW